MAGFENQILVCTNVNFNPSLAAPHPGLITTNGQLIIGSTALNAGGTHLNIGNITSPLGTLTIGYSSPNITIEIAGGGVALQHLKGNDGIAVNPDGSKTINILTANSTVQFLGTTNTETIDFKLTNLILGSSATSITTSVESVGLGNTALNALTTGTENTAIGYFSQNVNSTGTRNSSCGSNTLFSLTTAFDNTAVGSNALFTNISSNSNTATGSFSLYLCTGASNSAFGQGSLRNAGNVTQNTALGALTAFNLLTGSNNIFIGYLSGNSYTGAESSNILINNVGVLAETHVIRLGTQGSSSGQQNQCYLAGVLNTTSGRVVNVTSPGAYPYTTLTTDYVILVDTSVARTINLIASPVTGTTYRIKDAVGSAGNNNITIVPNAGNIDGSSSLVLTANYGSVDVVYSGTQWGVF